MIYLDDTGGKKITYDQEVDFKFDVVKYFTDKFSLSPIVYNFINSLSAISVLSVLYIMKGVLAAKGITLDIVEDVLHVGN